MKIIAAPTKIPILARNGTGALSKDIVLVAKSWWGLAKKKERSIAPMDKVKGTK